MTIADCLKCWNGESTLKWILARGVLPKKWKAYALHAGVVDGHTWTYEEIAQNGKLGIGKTRARVCQIMNEVEANLTREIPFSPHDSHCRRAVRNFLSWVRPERATSAYRLGVGGALRPKGDTVFVCGEKQWWCCGETRCGNKESFDPPLSMDLSWIADKRSRASSAKQEYAVVWCTSQKEVPTHYHWGGFISRYCLLVFCCDGNYYEFDHEEIAAGGRKMIFLKPLECRVVRDF